MRNQVVALYVRKDSIYKKMGIDSYDIERDSRTYSGSSPVVAHPPCRMWGRLKAFAKPRPDEAETGFHSVRVVRENGGVLEHPASSSLWSAAGLPYPGKIDQWGGYTICIDQFWFGHKCRKKTFLYIVGIAQVDLPDLPYSLDAATHVVNSSPGARRRKENLPEISHREREQTPEKLASWLILVASMCKPGKQ